MRRSRPPRRARPCASTSVDDSSQSASALRRAHDSSRRARARDARREIRARARMFFTARDAPRAEASSGRERARRAVVSAVQISQNSNRRVGVADERRGGDGGRSASRAPRKNARSRSRDDAERSERSGGSRDVQEHVRATRGGRRDWRRRESTTGLTNPSIDARTGRTNPCGRIGWRTMDG